MKKRVLIFILIALIFNGFKDAREVNYMAIVSSIGIDVTDENEYIITAEVFNTKKNDSSSSNSNPEIIMYESKANSVHKALRDMVKKSPNKLYLGHLDLVMLSENAAKEDVTEAVDFFIRDNEGSSDFMVVITKDITPQEILNSSSKVNSSIAKEITEIIKTTYKYVGSATDYLLVDNLDMILDDGRATVMSVISFDDENEISSKENEKSDDTNMSKDSKESGNESNSKDDNENLTPKFKSENIAYFKNRSFCGYLDENESIVYNLLKNKLQNTILTIGEGENLLVAEIITANSKLSPKYENDNFIVDIDVNIEADITEVGDKVRYEVNDKIDEYKAKLEEEITKKISDALYNYQNKYKEDIVGYGSLFYKYLPKEYLKVKDKFYNEYFQKVKSNVKINVEFPLEGGNMTRGR